MSVDMINLPWPPALYGERIGQSEAEQLSKAYDLVIADQWTRTADAEGKRIKERASRTTINTLLRSRP